MLLLDQSFTSDNFRKIFDRENRKGSYLEAEFFPEVEKITIDLKNCAAEFKELKKQRGQLSATEYEKRKTLLNEKKKNLKDLKEKLLTDELDKISKDIAGNDFRIRLKEISPARGKKVYTIDKDARAYFAVKQIQHNINRLYKVKQSNRYNILCQLRSLLNDKFSKCVVRTDLETFYESIPRKDLLERINNETLLTLSSKKIIRQILSEYQSKSGQTKGLPRGVGISAYLSELYARKLDEELKSQPDVIFYARYVDDIVIVYAPRPNSSTSHLLDDVKDKIAAMGLTVNNSKTHFIDLTIPRAANFEYLGYRFVFGMGSIILSLSRNKILRYKERIKLIFDDYEKKLHSNEKRARKILLKRVRFITGNARLLNNKKRAVVGIYFSNSLLSDPSSLAELDVSLTDRVNRIANTQLQAKLKKLSFVGGFNERRFHKFSTIELSEIVDVWKHVP